MAVVKDTIRPLARDRPSFSSSLPRQPMSARTRTQSATYNASDKNRVSRRRGSNMASASLSSALQAVAAGTEPNGISIKGANRSIQARTALGALNTGVVPAERSYGMSSSAVVEGPPLSALSDKTASLKIRRASDSTQKSTDTKRRGPADLQCEHCGKMYKHHSCLTKHLWEHTPEWGLTSKLLISKHQQVQLLEAASVLLAMNQDSHDSATMSSSDENIDRAESPSDDIAISSADEDSSPPPPSTIHHLSVPRKHRSPTSSTGYSNSYQSVFSTVEGPNIADLSSSRTPATSYNDGSAGEDQTDLAAAVDLLSCSFGTTASQPTGGSYRDTRPPMPAVPQQFQSAERHLANRADVEMKTESDFVAARRASSRSDDDEGVFGTMEE